MNARQYLAFGLATVFFGPVALAAMLFTPTPGPKWLRSYGKVFEKIAGPSGFKWGD